MSDLMEQSTQFADQTLGIYRTAATVKGGRRFSFGALVVVGDRNGRVGYGYGKGKEVPQAIEKAQRAAKRNLISIPRMGSTINHQVQGKYAASIVRLIPAAPGTGVVAGGVVRSVLDLAGVSDCLTKCYGSTNARNTIKAVFDGLGQLRTPQSVAELRGQTLERTTIEDKIEKGKAFMPARTGREKARGPVNTIGQDRKGGRGGRPGGGGRGRRGPMTEGPGPMPASDSPAASGAAPAGQPGPG